MTSTTFDRITRPQRGLWTELQQALGRWISFPWGTAAPRVPTRAEEAREVREFALQYQRTDPGFAADLLAAADRHEIGA
jgi:hypothetical protein